MNNKPIIFKYRGKEFPMILDLYALEKIEEELGGMTEVQKCLRSGKQFITIRKLFRIFANAGLEWMDQEETVTGDEIKRATVDEMKELADVIRMIITAGEYSETKAGEVAGDEKVDLYHDEEDEKNA